MTYYWFHYPSIPILLAEFNLQLLLLLVTIKSFELTYNGKTFVDLNLFKRTH